MSVSMVDWSKVVGVDVVDVGWRASSVRVCSCLHRGDDVGDGG